MKIQDILNAATAAGRSSSFIKALETVLPDECEFETDGVTIRKERPDSHGWTFAGLNQQDDGLPVDDAGNVTATPEWIETGYFCGNEGTDSIGYWKPLKCDSLPNPLSILVFVQGVNEGLAPVVKMLQTALNDYGAHLTIDGQIGDQTCNAAMACPDSQGLALAFLAKNRARYQSIAAVNPAKKADLNGWINRVNGLQTEFCNGGNPPQQVATTAPPPQGEGVGGLVVSSIILNC